jgi:hypothetical protein
MIGTSVKTYFIPTRQHCKSENKRTFISARRIILRKTGVFTPVFLRLSRPSATFHFRLWQSGYPYFESNPYFPCQHRPMSEQYYLRIDGQNKGPMSKDAIMAYAPSAETPVWYPALPEWTTVGAVPELAAMLPPVPPPFEPVAAPVPPPIPPVPPPAMPPTPPATAPIANTGKEMSGEPVGGGKLLKDRTLVFIVVGLVVVIAILFFLLNRPSSAHGEQGVPLYKDSLEAVQGRSGGADPSGEVIGNPPSPEDADEQARIAALTAKNMEYRNNWTNYIKASRSDYTTSGVGGIYGLSLTISNETEYPLEYVWVAVDYITVNGYRHKREILTFENIKPRTRQALYAPDSERGSSVSYEIISVSAPVFKFCYDAGSVGNGSTVDPWKCAN